MSGKPILFNTEMVRAILDGRKVQSRRPVRPQPTHAMPAILGPGPWMASSKCHSMIHMDDATPIHSPFGRPGGLLWVRETFCPVDDTDYGGKEWIDYRATPMYSDLHPAGWDSAPDDLDALKWKPSIHMPKKYARIWLSVVYSGWERLQDITESDAKSEGVRPISELLKGISKEQRLTSGELLTDSEYRAGFAFLWDEIYGDKCTWKSNPFVWKAQFTVIPKGTKQWEEASKC